VRSLLGHLFQDRHHCCVRDANNALLVKAAIAGDSVRETLEPTWEEAM